MQNYFRGVSGRHIKDTLIITLRNTGTKPWGKYKGYFKCVEEKSNYFFETIQIPEDIYPSNSLELVLNYPRIEKNNHQGDCFSTIQLVYKDQPYNSQVIRFRKDYDLLGNECYAGLNFVFGCLQRGRNYRLIPRWQTALLQDDTGLAGQTTI